jgi:DNA-binding transcriptional regulator YiaG
MEEFKMSQKVIKTAEDCLAFHEMDLQSSTDLTGSNVSETIIPGDAIKSARVNLGLSMEMMAILMGVNLPAMVRYENISLPPYPQGAVSRKMALLINWMADEKSYNDIIHLLQKRKGLATLSGLLQTESVLTYMNITAIKRLNDSLDAEPVKNLVQIIGNA